VQTTENAFMIAFLNRNQRKRRDRQAEKPALTSFPFGCATAD
jgi:hypothetical protein